LNIQIKEGMLSMIQKGSLVKGDKESVVGEGKIYKSLFWMEPNWSTKRRKIFGE